MISDCGNKLNCVKFKVWLYPEGNGHVEFCELPGSLPKDFPRKKNFSNIENLPEIMRHMEANLRSYEVGSVKNPLFFCEYCDVCFRQSKASLVPVSEFMGRFYLTNDLTKVVVCPRCGRADIRKVI